MVGGIRRVICRPDLDCPAKSSRQLTTSMTACVIDLFDRIFDHGMLADKPKIAAWRAALALRPSIKEAVVVDYPERLERFIMAQRGYLAALLPKQAA